MIDVVLDRPDITTITPNVIQAYGIKLLGVDIENVLTDYGDTTVRPEAIKSLDELRTASDGLTMVLITNHSNQRTPERPLGFVCEVSVQLSDMPYMYPGEGYKKKNKPDMFAAVAKTAKIEPKRAAMIDDQYKTVLGLRAAGWGTFFWTRPFGKHQHPRVKAFRVVESALIRPAMLAKRSMSQWKETIQGDYEV